VGLARKPTAPTNHGENSPPPKDGIDPRRPLSLRKIAFECLVFGLHEPRLIIAFAEVGPAHDVLSGQRKPLRATRGREPCWFSFARISWFRMPASRISLSVSCKRAVVRIEEETPSRGRVPFLTSTLIPHRRWHSSGSFPRCREQSPTPSVAVVVGPAPMARSRRPARSAPNCSGVRLPSGNVECTLKIDHGNP